MVVKERYIQQKSEYIDILNFVNYWIGKKKVLKILISGPPGIGKSFMVEKIAEELNAFLDEVKGDPGLTREDLEGVPILKKGDSDWKNGIIPRMIERTNRDGIAVLGVHEFNLIRIEIQPTLNQLFDFQSKFTLSSNANLTFKIEEGKTLIVLATINENIAGVMPIQDSVQSRFDLKIYLEYPDQRLESEILNMKTKIKHRYAMEICKFAKEQRNGARKGDFTRAISPRELIAFCSTLKVPGFSPKTAFEYTIVNKIAEMKSEINLMNDLADGKDLFLTLENVVFEDDPIKPKPNQTTQSTQAKIIDPTDVIDVKSLNRLSEPLKVQKGRTYKVNAHPSKVEYELKEYSVIPKGKWVPNDEWTAKILGNKELELHYKPYNGNKKVEFTKVKFQIV